MDTKALKRLEIKTDQQTLIMELQRDYRLSPVESKVLFTRLQDYLSEHQIVLTFLTEDDLLQHIQTKGRGQRLSLLRDRMARMLKESQEQVGPMAQSDLAAFFFTGNDFKAP